MKILLKLPIKNIIHSVEYKAKKTNHFSTGTVQRKGKEGKKEK